MPKRKSDEQLLNGIRLHSETARELSKQAHIASLSALNCGEPAEQENAMRTVLELQKLSYEETKKALRLQKVLLKRQIKMIEKQREQYLGNEKKDSP